MKEKDAAYYNRLFKKHTDMSRYENIYKKIGKMTDHTLDIGCGLAKLSDHIKDYKGFDIADEIIPDNCFVGNAYDKKLYKGDTFTATEVLEHLNDCQVVDNIPVGARFIFTVPSFKDPSHLRTYSEEDVRARFKELDIKSITRFNWHDEWEEGGQVTEDYILLVDSVKKPEEISVVMIVKNEEEMLQKALESVKWADEIIVCDTGSEDKTVEIAKKYTDKVYTDYKWNDSFAEARNHAQSKATKKWILIIDADEVLTSDEKMIRQAIAKAEKDGVDALEFKTHTKKEHLWSIRLFKKGDIKWVGAAHNYLVNIKKKARTDLTLMFGYSPAHKLDPDRTLRILEKNTDGARNKFYLAREYAYRSNFDKALEWYEKYIKESNFKAEICEAYLQMAKCKWKQSKGQEARNYCLKAIEGNPNFKEALIQMAEMSWPKQAEVWRKFADVATNEEVLFIRTK